MIQVLITTSKAELVAAIKLVAGSTESAEIRHILTGTTFKFPALQGSTKVVELVKTARREYIKTERSLSVEEELYLRLLRLTRLAKRIEKSKKTLWEPKKPAARQEAA